MTTPDSGDETLRNLETEVADEIAMVEASHPETEAEQPVTEWLFDPTDAVQEEVGLRNLRDAIEAVETLEHPGDNAC